MQRRDVLRGALAVAAIPPICCTTPPLPPDSITFAAGQITVHLARIPELGRNGAAFNIVDQDRGINIILIHVEQRRYVAMDRSCTHGGAQCTYNAKRHTVQCTSLNHAEYDLHGTLLHGRTHGNLRTYATETSGSKLVIHLGQNA